MRTVSCFLIVVFFNINSAWASPSRCEFETSKADYLDLSETDTQKLLDKLKVVGDENPLNAGLWQDFENLIQNNPSQEPRIQPESSLAIQHLPGCPELLVSSDPQVKAEPGTTLTLKNFAFEWTYSSPAGVIQEENTLGSISLNKYMVLSGNILIESSCESPLGCDQIVQVYTKKLDIEIYRMGTVGGSTSAGGIIQFQ